MLKPPSEYIPTGFVLTTGVQSLRLYQVLNNDYASKTCPGAPAHPRPSLTVPSVANLLYHLSPIPHPLSHAAASEKKILRTPLFFVALSQDAEGHDDHGEGHADEADREAPHFVVRVSPLFLPPPILSTAYVSYASGLHEYMRGLLPVGGECTHVMNGRSSRMTTNPRIPTMPR